MRKLGRIAVLIDGKIKIFPEGAHSTEGDNVDPDNLFFSFCLFNEKKQMLGSKFLLV